MALAVTTVIAGETMVDTGILLRSSQSNGLTVSNREALVAITAVDDLTLRASADSGWRATGYGTGALDVEGELAGRSLRVYVQAADEATRVSALLPDVAALVYSKSPNSGPTMTIWVTDDATHPFHAVVNADGRLFVAVDPIPADAVVTRFTGERLDVSRALVEAYLRSGSSTPDVWTSCDLPGVCTAGWTGAFTAATGGVLTCVPNEYLQLDLGRYTLHLEDHTGGTHPVADCNAAHVGDIVAFDTVSVPPSTYTVSAIDSDGTPADVVAALDGTLYVGHIAHALGCPCLHGN